MANTVPRIKRRAARLAGVVLVLFALLFTSLPVFADAAPTDRTTVKAGFFSWDGYHNVDENGVRSGYGYDFLKMAENYANWRFTFVSHDQGWAEMLKMLEDGRIDLLTFATKTPEREARFAYSDSPIGTAAVRLTVKENDPRYRSGDPTSYAGMRVGFIGGSVNLDSLEEYSAKTNFSYRPVSYSSLEKLHAALMEGSEVDAILSSSMRPLDNETVLETLDPTDFYVITRKDDTALMAQVNTAIEQMDLNSPGWRLALKNKYFSAGESNLSLTLDEQNFLSGQTRPLTVVTNPDLAPYSYFEKGEAKGIVPDIFREIASRLGLDYRFVSLETYHEYRQYILDDSADIDLTCFASYGLAANHGLDISSTYMSTTLSLLTRTGGSAVPQKVAVIRDFNSNNTYSGTLMAQQTCTEYDTVAQCIAAVLNGTEDAAYLYTYTAQAAVEQDDRNRLSYTTLPEYSLNLAIGVKDTEDYRLMALLNKGIASVGTTYTPQVVQQQLAESGTNRSLLALIYDRPDLAMLALGAGLLLLFACCLAAVGVRNASREHRQSGELARFTGYVCELNESVMEINLDTRRCVLHFMENGVLQSREIAFKYFDLSAVREAFFPEDFARLTEGLTDFSLDGLMQSHGGKLYFEARARDLADRWHWYSYTIQTIPKDDGHKHNYIMFKKDIDAARQEEDRQRQALTDALEAAKSASAAKGQFLSRMSHEIRTPLNAVIGYMDIAKESTDNPAKMLHCVQNSDLAARHLLNIINDVLDISSIESGKMKIANTDFDLKNLLSTVSTLFYNQAKEKGVRFEAALHGITEEWVVGDSLRVNQVLMNLLSNAIKFTPKEGRITLTVSQLRKDDQRVYLNFAVQDTGIGMSADYQKKLFQPFEQESASTARKYGGSGLGLSITFNLVQMMGGSIDVKSAPGEGSAFVVALSFGLSSRVSLPEGPPADYSRLRALVVDDEASSCDYMKALLKRCGVRSDTVTSGEEALRQLRRRQHTEYKYDLCLMDWNMPGLDGIETAKKIREECGDELPIVIATAYDVTGLEDEAKAAGVSRVIAKPLFQSTMFDLLVSTYGKYQPVSARPAAAAGALQGLKILLAEDNDMNLEIATDILSRAGIAVTPAVNGKQAVDTFEAAPEGSFDAILMDVQMPIMDGYEATGRIRASARPWGKTIPILAMTANAFTEDITAALAAGMDGHIAKPIDYDKLFAALAAHVKR